MLSAARVLRRKLETVDAANRPAAEDLRDPAPAPDARETAATAEPMATCAVADAFTACAASVAFAASTADDAFAASAESDTFAASAADNTFAASAAESRTPEPSPLEARPDRNLNVQITGIQDFIGRLECEIATRHGQRAERALTLKALRQEVSDLEIALDEASGARWINLVEQYNTVKTRLTQLAEIDKRQTEIDISDEPHMEAELQKWRLRLAYVAPRGQLH